VAATREGFAVITDEGSLDTRVPLLSPNDRFNDGKCDALGRFWAGSNHLEFLPGHGALHVLERDWTSRKVLDGLTLPNGLGWSPDQQTFYLVDSLEYCLLAFDFHLATGSLGGSRRIHEFDRDTGIPDGLTVDQRGRIWVARWGGGMIDCLTPAGRFLGSLAVPVSQPSSCAFVGSDLSILAVTSARQGLDADASALDGSVLGISEITVAGDQARGTATSMFGG
jgi:sugar lactone lactonase YvrE